MMATAMAIRSSVSEPAATTRAPIVIERAEGRVPAALLVLIASWWIVAPAQAWWHGDSAALGPFVAYGAPLAGVVLALIGLVRWRHCTRIAIEHGIVEVTELHLASARTTREPLASYTGLRVRWSEQPHRYGPRRWYILELHHPDPSKLVVLASAKDRHRIERRGRELGRSLGLPLSGAPPAATGATAAAPVQAGVHRGLPA